MKNLKKAIAILLAVLMVAFSVPFTALAQDDYSNTVVKVYFMPFASSTAYGYKDASTATILDPTNVSKADLTNDKFVIYIAVEGLEDASVTSLSWFFDPEVMSVDSILEKPSTISETSSLVNADDDCTMIDKVYGQINPAFAVIPAADFSGITETSYAAGSIPGVVFGAFECTLLEDSFDFTQYVSVTYDDLYGFDLIDMTYLDDAHPTNYNDANGTEGPEFAVAYATPSAAPPTDVTWTFIGGSTADYPEGTTPANTATAYAENGDGTHTKTAYTWNGTTEVVDTANSGTEQCENYTAAVEPVHTQESLVNGATAGWNCSLCGSSQTATTITAQHTYTTNTVAATCVAEGYTVYTCSCGDSYQADYTAIDTNNHADGCTLVTDEAVAATCTTTGLTAGSHYSICGTVAVAQTTTPIDANNHDYQVTASTGATCSTPGSVTYTCSRCGDSYTDTGAYDPTNHEGTLVTDEAVPATCVATGLTAGSHWSCCGAVEVAQETVGIDATNHAGTIAIDPSTVVTATCTTEGYTGDTKCSECGNVVETGTNTGLDADNHTGTLVTYEVVAPTRTTDGLTAGSHWDCCGKVEVAQEVIPATGVQITVNSSDLGTVTVKGTVSTGAAIAVPYVQSYTLAAEDGSGKFVGWMIGNKFVSTSATYTTAAFADTVYTAVFEGPTASAFDITFVDKFNNVIATYSSTDVASWTEIPEIASPFDGYTISGYDKTLEQIQAATEALTVTANYEKAEKTFTINAEGATITVAGVEYNNTATVTGYDVPVTVTADGATAWTVNGKEAGFGASYTFYATSDVTISFTTAAAEAAPVVTAVNGSGDLQSNGKVRFLASRSVPADYKVVESGFVYGLDVAADDLDLDKVNGTTIKVYKNNNTANEGQFAVNYNVSAAVATASVRAYLIVKTNTGVVLDPIYADVQTYTK